MSPLRSQTLIRLTTCALSSSAAWPRVLRRLSTLPDSSLQVELAAAEESEAKAKANAVEKIEDVIHSFIVRRSRPDWLTFVPGGSYWVPPRRTSYGVSGIVETLSNALTEEEYLSLTTVQGWPSSSFYIHNDTSSYQVGFIGGEEEMSPTTVVIHEEEGKGKADVE
ncbi:uncharacterized protein LOC130989625 [Salvia miltiorrhiza]|uniref:uncharacterized protein LOC130989625 n=1 Tax=Salvia miltiorrhiza TaxID=226208 RepID=UPI0025AC1C08|nr:uncharacterized protein LOC130989625 [Salvia miltiorrhiza]